MGTLSRGQDGRDGRESQHERILQEAEYVQRIATAFWRRGSYDEIGMEELQSEAMCALVEGADLFVPEKQVLTFRLWISRRVIWRLRDFVRNWHRVRTKCVGARDFLDFSTRQRANQRSSQRANSGSNLDKSDRDALIGDTDLNCHTMHWEELMQVAGEHLDERSRQILQMSFKSGLSLKDIAQCIGVTHVRARQLHSAAIKVLRKKLQNHTLN